MQDIDHVEWKGETKKYLNFIKMFGAFARGQTSSTYKPIFLKCLLDLRHYANKSNRGKINDKKNWVCIKNDKIRLDLNFIGVRFLKYYWDMEYSFKFKQSSDPHDANIRKIIQDLEGKYKKPPTIQHLSTNANAKNIKRVIDMSMKPEVMIHLPKNMPDLFEKDGSSHITLDSNIIGFFDEHYNVVANVINYKLVSVLERYNKATPRISIKVDDGKTRRPALEIIKRNLILQKQNNNCCFYCNKSRKETHFDHVIPFSYIYSHDIYNIVATCQKCNCEKHDKLPTDDLFDLVIERNEHWERLVSENSLGSVKTSTNTKFGKVINDLKDYSESQYRALYDSYAASSGRKKFRPDLIAG